MAVRIMTTRPATKMDTSMDPAVVTKRFPTAITSTISSMDTSIIHTAITAMITDP